MPTTRNWFNITLALLGLFLSNCVNAQGVWVCSHPMLLTDSKSALLYSSADLARMYIDKPYFYMGKKVTLHIRSPIDELTVHVFSGLGFSIGEITTITFLAKKDPYKNILSVKDDVTMIQSIKNHSPAIGYVLENKPQYGLVECTY